MKTPHLISALSALLVVIVAAFAGVRYAESVEARYVHALAAWQDRPDTLARPKTLGSALQRAAFRAPDLLPVYGASELAVSGKYHASILFQKYPTGFNIFVVGDVMVEPVILFQRLAAMGSELRGKKVVITLSPDFAMTKISSRDAYAYNFSPLHACESAFSTDLSLAWKQEAARRMTDYPETLAKHPVLNFALQSLASDSPLGRVQYFGAFPLGQLECQILQLQDHWEVLSAIRNRPNLKPNVTRQAKTLNWDELLDSAQNEYAMQSDNNPFGFNDDVWNGEYRGQPPLNQQGWGDTSFLIFMNKTKGWTDLDLLLRALKELGAEPLLLSAPLDGPYFDYVGISPQARSVYYDKLRATAKPYDVWLLDFREHESDKNFFVDAMFHLSWPAWVYYAETMDAFYHGTLGVGK